MRNFLPGFLSHLPVLLLVAAISSFNTVTVAQHITDQDIARSVQDSDESEDDDQGEARVARISFISGDVSFLRNGESEWAAAVVNLPLVEGDHVYCPTGARVEIQFGRGTYIRLSEKSELAIAALSESVAQIEITEGTANIRVDYLAAAFDRFEVDTPVAALLLQKDGQYRIDVGGGGDSEIVVRRGVADVTTDDGSFKLRQGHKLLVRDGGLQIALDNSLDDWDRWNYDRDATIDSASTNASPDYVASYETDYNSFYGASDLSSYGSWTDVQSYGHCWVPRVSSSWAPYRAGEWVWIPRFGWTWISHEPWGWAPYHYGRWVYISGIGWAWSPGFNSFPHRRNYFYWRPALVAFFNCPTPRGHYVGWYPLRPGERWHRPDRYGNHAGLRNGVRGGSRRGDDRDIGRRHGVSVLPISGLIRTGDSRRGSSELGRSRPQAPDRDLGGVINGNHRPGLPTGSPERSAMAPGGKWTSVRPTAEVISRPVLTRNLPQLNTSTTNTQQNQSGNAYPRRERRLVEAKPIGSVPGRTGGRRLDVDGGVITRGDQPATGAGEGNGGRSERVRPPRPSDRNASNSGNESESSSGSTNRGWVKGNDSVIVRTPPKAPGGERDASRETSNDGSSSGGDSRPRVRRDNSDTNGGRNRGERGNQTGGGEIERRDRNSNENDGGRWKTNPETINRSGSENSDNGPRRNERQESQPEPRAEPRRERPERQEPRPEPRVERQEQPRSEPKHEQPAPRVERNESRPEPRVERQEQPRSEPKQEQRSEPRSEPKHERPAPQPEKPQPAPERPRKP